MARFGPRLAVALTLLSLGLASAQTAPAPSAEILCPQVSASPALDGRLDEWPALSQVVMASPDEWHPASPQSAEYGGPEDVSAEVRMAWDQRALYLALGVRDDALVRVRSASEIDRGDSIVLSLAAEGSEEVNQFVVALLRGSSLVWRAQPASRAGADKTAGRGIWARQEESGAWLLTYELSFPWADLAPLRPIPGQEFTLTVSICDDDGSGIEGCLEQAIPVVFSADSGGPGPLVSRPAALPPSFPKPDIARFDRRALLLQGKPVLAFGGEVDYARLPPPAWTERIALLKAAGMNTVSVVVPWAQHQPTPDRLDLSPLREFLALCGRSGLHVQLNLGPYAGDDWEAGGVPGWVVSRGTMANEGEPIAGWYRALLSVVKQHQVTEGGPVVAVVIRPLPDAAGKVEARALQALLELVRGAGLEVPVLTANAPAARDNSKQSLANMLDTLAFYQPFSLADALLRLRSLAGEENGPAWVSALPGAYATRENARRSASAVKAALGAGSTAVMVAGFAAGASGSTVRSSEREVETGVVDAAGGRTAGFGELKLVGDLLRTCGAELARAVAAEGLVKADDPAVQAVARLGEKSGLIFLWDERGEHAHQVRLTYAPPGTTSVVSIPEAGAIALPAGCAKALPLDVPVGRGTLHYSTSEIAGIHQLGERTLLVLYGDTDTPGEIALRWPGPPLVSGEVTRQRWDPERSLLILDYYHAQKDQYLLVDELEVAILSRERAAATTEVAGETGRLTLCAGAQVAAASLGASGLEASLECPEGAVQVSVALPRAPSSVMVDGKPVDFSFGTPLRVLTFAVTTAVFEEDTRASGLDRLGRLILGGPPQLAATFDRGWFMPDAAAADGPCRRAGALGVPPESLGLSTGAFARLRANLPAAGASRLRLRGSTDPALVLVDGDPVPGLSGGAAEREADLVSPVTASASHLEIVLDLLPRADGFAGLWESKRLPEVLLTGEQGEAPLGDWEVCAGLAGESAGWTQLDLDTSRWHFLRFGPWRRQGREVAKVSGVGWYRIPFGLPRPGEWRIPYDLRLDLRGSAAVFVNGSRVATCLGDGVYRVLLPAAVLTEGGENILALAVHGLAPETGVNRIEIAADRERMTRRRALSIGF